MIGKSNKRPPPAVKFQGGETTKIKRARESVQRDGTTAPSDPERSDADT